MSQKSIYMHAACCRMETAGLSKPEGEIERPREKRDETKEKEREDKLKDISAQFLDSSRAWYYVSLCMCFSDREVR